MNKKDLRKHTKRILLLGFVLGLTIGIIIGAVLVLKDNTCEDLKEDYDWLESSSKNCWNKLRMLDTKCWDASDCIENPELEGCHKSDCNWCCFNSCTLMGCGRNKELFANPAERER